MASAGERTHYQVLGVAAGASSEDIRRAHRQLARVLHPDRLSDSPTAERALAERRMREVNAAWTTLSDPRRRSEYDRSLATGARAGGGASRTHGAGAAGSSGSGRGTNGGRSGASSGSRRPEDADDPDGAFARARTAEIDADEPELSTGHFWLLRRGPVVAISVVALVLFVVTAYAGSSSTGSGGTSATSTTAAAPACVRNIEGRTSVWVSCLDANDGRVVTFVDTPLDCPARTSYVIIDDRVGCATTDPTLMSDLTPTTRG